MEQQSKSPYKSTNNKLLSVAFNRNDLLERSHSHQPLQRKSSDSSVSSLDQPPPPDINLEDSDQSLKALLIGTRQGLRASQRRRREKMATIERRYAEPHHDLFQNEQPECITQSSESTSTFLSDGPETTIKQCSPRTDATQLERIARYLNATQKHWYLPDVPTAEVYRRLKYQPVGSFIVWRSANETDFYRLYYKHPNGSTQYIDIDYVYNRFVLRGQPRSAGYPSLIHLVAIHCHNAYTLPCVLQVPSQQLINLIASPISRSMTNILDAKGSGSVNRGLNFGQFTTSSLSKSPGGAYPSRFTKQTPMVRRSADSKNKSQWHKSASSLIPQGAACKLFYFGHYNVDGLTDTLAIKVCVDHILEATKQPRRPIPIEFRVNESGITLTDFEQRFFTKRHIPASFLSYIGVDPLRRAWHAKPHFSEAPIESRIFGFTSHNPSLAIGDNQCHILSEYEQTEQAETICAFTQRYFNLRAV